MSVGERTVSLSSCGLSRMRLGATVVVLSLTVGVVVSQEPPSRDVPFLLNPMLAPESVCAGLRGDGKGSGGCFSHLKAAFSHCLQKSLGYWGCPGILWSLPATPLLPPLILKYPELDSSWGDTLWSVHRPGGQHFGMNGLSGWRPITPAVTLWSGLGRGGLGEAAE